MQHQDVVQFFGEWRGLELWEFAPGHALSVKAAPAKRVKAQLESLCGFFLDQGLVKITNKRKMPSCFIFSQHSGSWWNSARIISFGADQQSC